MSRRKDIIMKENKHRNQQPAGKVVTHMLFVPGSSIMDEPEDLFVEPFSPYDTVTIPRSEYECLVSKATINNLIRDMLRRNKYVSSDDLRKFLSIDEAFQEDANA